MDKPTVLYEDADLLVLNKPSGVTVNKADTTRNEETMQDFTEKYLDLPPFKKEEYQQKTETGEYNPEFEFFSRGGIVHRLDKETSGILLVAKNPESFSKLKQQFMERTVKKTYLALAHGKVLPEEGEIAVPVGRLEFNRKRFGVVAGGRESVTKYKVVGSRYLVSKKQREPLTLVEMFPQTGRTHQIRVHLKHINHPIFADELYAGRKTSRDDRRYLPRLFLHAHTISFLHPKNSQELTFTSPLPQELQTFFDSLEK